MVIRTRAGTALIDIVVATVLLGVVLVVLLRLLGQAASAQTSGEHLQTAAMLLDEQLNLVLARGPDNYASRFAAEGACDSPFESFRYRLTFSGGTGGDPYAVRASVYWEQGGAERSASIETMVSPRVGEDTDPIRTPAEVIERLPE
jgi:hypothetical protein